MCQFRELFLTSSQIRTSCSSSSYSTFPLAGQFIPSHHLQVAPISLWIKYWKGNWTKFIQEIDNDYDSFSLSFFNFFSSSPSMTDNNGGGLPTTHHPFYKFNRHRKYARGQTNKGTLKFGSSCGKYSATEFTLVGRVQEHEDREKEGKLNGIEICRAVFSSHASLLVVVLCRTEAVTLIIRNPFLCDYFMILPRPLVPLVEILLVLPSLSSTVHLLLVSCFGCVRSVCSLKIVMLLAD